MNIKNIQLLKTHPYLHIQMYVCVLMYVMWSCISFRTFSLNFHICRSFMFFFFSFVIFLLLLLFKIYTITSFLLAFILCFSDKSKELHFIHSYVNYYPEIIMWPLFCIKVRNWKKNIPWYFKNKYAVIIINDIL